MAQIQVNSASQVQTLPKTTARPAAEPTKPAVAETALQSGDQLQSYTVKKGDNLWNISKAQLGDPTKWKTIHNLNTAQVRNPDLIYPNQVLTLPILAHPAQPAQPAQPAAPAEPPVAPAEPPAAPSEPTPAAPAQPTPGPAPAQPAPAQPQPAKPKSHLLSDVGKAAAIGGTVGAVGTAATLTVMTARLAAPLSNLGGYGTAQVVASKLASVGMHVPQGPALSKLISSVGGPKVAAAGVAVGVGIAAAGIAAGGYYLYRKASDK